MVAKHSYNGGGGGGGGGVFSTANAHFALLLTCSILCADDICWSVSLLSSAGGEGGGEEGILCRAGRRPGGGA